MHRAQMDRVISMICAMRSTFMKLTLVSHYFCSSLVHVTSFRSKITLYLCSKLEQSVWVHCLFTGQFKTKDYGTFTDVI